jgi:hypothetical protein
MIYDLHVVYCYHADYRRLTMHIFCWHLSFFEDRWVQLDRQWWLLLQEIEKTILSGVVLIYPLLCSLNSPVNFDILVGYWSSNITIICIILTDTVHPMPMIIHCCFFTTHPRGAGTGDRKGTKIETRKENEKRWGFCDTSSSSPSIHASCFHGNLIVSPLITDWWMCWYNLPGWFSFPLVYCLPDSIEWFGKGSKNSTFENEVFCIVSYHHFL